MGEDTKKGTFEFWTEVRAATEAKAAEVPQTVTNHYVDKEIDARVELTIRTIDALEDLQRQIKKLRPDQEVFDAAGSVVSSGYSKVKLEERKKLMERQERMEAALSEVFENGTFDKLKKLNLGAKAESDVAA